MSFHFRNGETYAQYADVGPGIIIVDPRASIQTALLGFDALTLAAGPWTLNIKGDISAEDGSAIALSDAGFTSKVKFGIDANIVAGEGSGIRAAHVANVTNAGKISASDAGIDELGNGNFRISNLKAGLIEGQVFGIYVSSGGSHTIANAGTISGDVAAINASSGIELVTNSGAILGTVFLGDGADTFVNFAKIGQKTKHGVVDGFIGLGDGDDRFFGGRFSETVVDDAGKDTYKLGGGNDLYSCILNFTGDLVDVVDGGKGSDTYAAGDSGVLGAFINLDKIDHFGFAANTADDIERDPANASDTVRNFENAIGTTGDDVIIGSSVSNELSGGLGMDSLTGLRGRDALTGGDSRDFFIFTSLKDSGSNQRTRDTITDFEDAGVAGGDLIDLSTLNERLGDIIDFLGVNVNFAGNAGDLRAIFIGDNTIVQLDANGDKKVDFSVLLVGQHSLASGDLLL
jgi:Ca2+-binding RTX toxin-like protein